MTFPDYLAAHLSHVFTDPIAAWGGTGSWVDAFRRAREGRPSSITGRKALELYQSCRRYRLTYEMRVGDEWLFVTHAKQPSDPAWFESIKPALVARGCRNFVVEEVLGVWK